MTTGKTEDKTRNYEPSHFCGKLACLGEPWCTEWESCNFRTEVEKSVVKGTSKNETKEVKESQVQRRFTNPKSDEEVNEIRATAVPKKTKEDTEYCMRIWNAWWKERIASNETRDDASSEVDEQIIPLLQMSKEVMKHWLTLFVLEVRKQNGTEYPPNTLHHIVCGIMRYLRQNAIHVDFFQDPVFADFCQSLDAEMKRLKGSGLGSQKKQAEPLTEQNEEKLWEAGALGAHNPQALLNTMIYMNGLYFALCSGDEHRQLRHNPCQIQLVECPGERPYLEYTEDISKNHQGGLKGRNQKPKVVKQFANLENPERCFVKLFKLYRYRCPVKHHDDAFYLIPLRDPKGQCWYSNTPLGHNKFREMQWLICVSKQVFKVILLITRLEQQPQHDFIMQE